MNLQEVIERLRRACRQAGGQNHWARRHGLSQAYVSDVLTGKKPPGPRLLAALGLRLVTTYRPVKGTL